MADDDHVEFEQIISGFAGSRMELAASKANQAYALFRDRPDLPSVNNVALRWLLVAETVARVLDGEADHVPTRETRAWLLRSSGWAAEHLRSSDEE